MPVGIVGTTAWALIIGVTEQAPSTVKYADPPVHLETESQCKSIADAINSKASQAGVESRISARCTEIEYIDPATLNLKP